MSLTFTAAVSNISKVVRAAGSWVTDGIVPYIYVQFGGAGITVANIGPFKVSSISTTTNANDTLNLYDPDGVMVTEGSLAAATAKASWIRNGVIKRSFTFEKFLSGLNLANNPNQYIQFTGMRPAELVLNFKAQAILDGAFTFWGKLAQLSASTIASVTTQPNTNPVVSASANIGTIWRAPNEGNPVDLTDAMKDLSLTISNTPRHRPIIGSKYDADIGYGLFDVKTSGTALTEDLTLFNDVIAHNDVGLSLPISDSLGNLLIITVPAQKLTGNPDTPAANQDVDMKFNGMAKIDPNSGVTIQFDRIITGGYE